MKFLSEAVRVEIADTPTAVGTTAVTTDIIDMAAAEGFDSVMFIVHWGAITDGTPNVKIQQGAAAAMGDAADLEDSDTEAAITDDNTVTIVDIQRPQERYLRAVITRGGSTGAVINGVLALLYNSKAEPVTQSDDVAVVGKLISPDEGTA